MAKQGIKPTRENIAFVFIAAWPEPEQQIEVFRRSAERQGINLHSLDYGKPWKGYYFHKITQMRYKTRELLNRGYQYMFYTDSRDVVFVDNLDSIWDVFESLYKDGVLFAADKPMRSYPFEERWFTKIIIEQTGSMNGIANAGCYAGQIDEILSFYDRCDMLRERYVNRNFTDWKIGKNIYDACQNRHINDDQFFIQLLQTEEDANIHVDRDKELFAVFDNEWPSLKTRETRQIPDERSIGTAQILHSPWLSHRFVLPRDIYPWREWAAREHIIET